MKLPKQIKQSKGFTLIELIVVIAILGVLAAVLITTINPVDKINSANDSGAMSTITQLGKANDSYATSTANNNNYPVATTFGGVVSALNTAGEIKQATITAPNTNYTFTYLAPAGCVAATPTSCTTYAFYTNLKSSKYALTPYFVYANGKSCLKGAAPTDSTVANTCP